MTSLLREEEASRGPLRKSAAPVASLLPSKRKGAIAMRKPVCLIVIAALSVASSTAGCKSGAGWTMPGSSLVGWGKKKPSTSSIAGTRSTPQPPSVNVPPYPAGTSSTGDSYANRSAPGASYGASGYSNSAAPANDMYTGPYSMSGSNPTASSNTQNGFYSTSTPSGPSAYSADARGSSAYGAGTSSASGSSYGNASPPNYGTTAPSYGTTAPSYGTSSPSYGTSTPSYGTTPNSSYGTPASGASGYGTAPSTPSYGTPGTGSYPTTPSGAGAYPSTPSTSSGFSTGSTSTYGSTPGTAASYSAPPASSYGTPSTYGATPNTSSSTYGTATYGPGSVKPPVMDSSYSATGGSFRPGSTNRNSGLISGEGVQPAGFGGGTSGSYPATTGSTGNSSYPGTYSR
jgi:hypothetical protein